jgi:hypothetical protein
MIPARYGVRNRSSERTHPRPHRATERRTTRENRPASRLLHDLGIDGDDAADLLRDYSTSFDVDMSGFDFDRFFGGEPHLFNFGDSGSTAKDRWLPLTVEDLYRSALHKKFSGCGSAI